jgi:hypothetical protein
MESKMSSSEIDQFVKDEVIAHRRSKKKEIIELVQKSIKAGYDMSFGDEITDRPPDRNSRNLIMADKNKHAFWYLYESPHGNLFLVVRNFSSDDDLYYIHTNIGNAMTEGLFKKLLQAIDDDINS